MSTPAYLNPSTSPFPLVELKEDHQQLQFFTPQFQASSSLSTPIFFNITQDQRESHSRESQVPNNQKVDKYVLHGGSSDHPIVDDHNYGYKSPNYKIHEEEDENKRSMKNGSTKWMSSKMRLMKKMMSSSYKGTKNHAMVVQKFDDHNHNYNGTDHDHDHHTDCNNNIIIRVCSDCNTTKTPLWRSGPQGPKSLCNACGIRQRKARRAMAANAMALNGSVLGSNASPTRTKVQNKEKKSRSSYIARYKKPFKLTGPSQSEKKLSFDDFALSLHKNISDFQRAFPKDEEEAAILLMALSCGLIDN